MGHRSIEEAAMRIPNRVATNLVVFTVSVPTGAVLALLAGLALGAFAAG